MCFCFDVPINLSQICRKNGMVFASISRRQWPSFHLSFQVKKTRWGGKQLTNFQLENQFHRIYDLYYMMLYHLIQVDVCDACNKWTCQVFFQPNGSSRTEVVQAKWAILGLGGESRVTGAPADPLDMDLRFVETSGRCIMNWHSTI